MEDDEDNTDGISSALERFKTIAQGFESEHRNLAEKVEVQTQRARDDIAKDRQAFKQQLQVACGSMKRTIEAVTPNQKLLSYESLSRAVFGPRNSLSDICRELITHFDHLAALAANANRKLNAVYRDAMETETEIDELTPQLVDFGVCVQEVLEAVEGVLGEAQEMSRELTESREEAEKELEMRQLHSMVHQYNKRHAQKKARWLWAGALVTGGLTAPFALAANSSKRTNRRLRDFNVAQAITVEAKLEKCQEAEAQLEEKLEEIRDASSDVEATKELLDEVTEKNNTLTTFVQTQLEHYSNLKEQAMMVASQARELQGRVETLTYTEGATEVRHVMLGLMEDLQQSEMKPLIEGTGVDFQRAARLLIADTGVASGGAGTQKQIAETSEWEDYSEYQLSSLTDEDMEFLASRGT